MIIYKEKGLIMKKLIMMGIVILSTVTSIKAQDIFSTDKGQVSFFSKAPVADVDAVDDKLKVEVNTATNEVTCTIVMKDFNFKNDKMGRDAKDKYIETEAFPHAGFKGKIEGKINYYKPGSYPVTAVGRLTIHGVTKEVSEKGTVIVQKGQIKLESQFNVQLKDYNIEAPKILGQEMTEDHMLVKVNATLTQQVKKTITPK
jgi:polyisoprenoid-binding protein YceI